MNSPEQTLQAEYRRRFESAAEYRQRVWKVLCRDYFSKIVKPDSTLLDVGCGWGEFVNHVEARKKYAMDLNPDARGRLASDVSFLHQDCSQPWPLEPGSLDVVFSSNFLEHLPSKSAIEQTLVEAHRTLKVGGKIVLLGPNIRYVPNDYWDFWDHHIAMSDRSVAEILGLTGFEIEQQVARFLPYTMSGTRNPPLALLSAYLRMPAIWPLFGKQFLVVGERVR